MTPFIKKKDLKKIGILLTHKMLQLEDWHHTFKSTKRKNKPTFNPHMDNGDFVVVTNIDKIKFTGKKFINKKYYRHTGHPGGIKDQRLYH